MKATRVQLLNRVLLLIGTILGWCVVASHYGVLLASLILGVSVFAGMGFGYWLANKDRELNG